MHKREQLLIAPKNVMNVINLVSTTAAEAVAGRLAAGSGHNHHLAQKEEKKTVQI